MGEKTRRRVRRNRIIASQTDPLFTAEGLERRMLLSSAIAAFGLQQTFATGSQPRAVVIADLNLDGKPDLIIANAVSNTVSVLLGNGNGTFQNQQTFAAGAGPFAMAVADVNQDGKPDLIFADNGANAVSVLLGNGNGTFQLPVSFATGTAPRSVAVADLNGDGKPDLVATDYSSNNVSILLGNGNGTFQLQQTFAAGSQPRSVAIADVNLDGKPDLIVANHGSNSVSVLVNGGTGTFPTQTTYATGATPFSVTTADVNLDGKPDILVANSSSNSVSVLLNTGTGSFQSQQTFAAGAGPIAIASADINGDGKPDLVVANYNANTAGVLLGNGDGSFQVQKTFVAGAGPRSIALADLNRDGRQDIIAGNSSANSTSVLLGDVPPTVLSINRANPVAPVTTSRTVGYTVTFSEPVTGVDASDFTLALKGVTATTPVTVSGSGAVYTVTISGINGSGTLGLNLTDDGSIKNAAGNPIQPGGAFPFGTARTFATVQNPRVVAAADLNGDGTPDLVVSSYVLGNYGSGAISVLLGNGNGTFAPQATFAAARKSRAIAIADLNGDGKPDLVIGTWYGSSIEVFLGNGDGSFKPAVTFGIGAGPSAVEVADVNGDGIPDIVTANYFSNTFSVLAGNGDGTFRSLQSIASPITRPNAAAMADINGDGKLDIVAGSTADGLIAVLLGNGNGTFQAPPGLDEGAQAASLLTTDINGDGRPDVLVADQGGYWSGAMLGNGDGTFQPAKFFQAGKSQTSMTLADFNSDGEADLVVTNANGTANLLLGNGNGTFQTAQTFAVGSSAASVLSPNLNRDGQLDLVVANNSTATITVLLGNSSGSFAGQVYDIAVGAIAINRQSPATQFTAGSSVSYAVTFNASVTGVDASDFRVLTTGSVAVSAPLSVSGSSNSYIVTISGIHGDGTLQLDLLDNGSIHDGFGNPMGGGGVNGNFAGQTYNILQTFPTVVSFLRGNHAGPVTSATTVSFTLTFSEPVTGLDAADFSILWNGVPSPGPVLLSGGGAVYTVSVSGISGSGSLGLNFSDDGDVRDLAGNPLQSPGVVAFRSPQSFATGFGGSVAAAVADVNLDGKPDIVAANNQGHTLGLLTGSGTGSFNPVQLFAAHLDPRSVAVADVNGDGFPDLINANEFGAGVLLANGNGTFAPQVVFPAGITPNSVSVADVNGDGKLDILTASSANVVSVLLGNGNGTFQTQITADSGPRPYSVTVADLNGDGKPDVVIVNQGSIGTVSVLLGNGDGTFQGTFQYGRVFQTGPYPRSVAVGDVNGDGKADLLVANFDGTISVLLGNGDGLFQPQRTFTSGPQSNSIAVQDVNGDGRPDLIVANYGSSASPGNTFSVLLGNGDGTFQPAQTFLSGPSPYSITTADVNGDGRPDVVVANDPLAPGEVNVILAKPNQIVASQTYTIVPPADTITGTNGNDQIALTKDPDGTDLDWTLGTSSGVLPINDPNGLTINGNGGNDTITLDYTNGNPLPNFMHLSSGTGTLTITGLQGTSPLVDTTLDIGRSTIFISFSPADPIAAIQGYLRNGYNSGAWNGTANAITGAITSAAAQANPNHNTAIGYADFADGQGANTTPNTIELTYTLYGDANLDHQVNSADLQILLAFLNRTGAWDQGDFNYDGQVNSADLQALLFTLNTSLGSQATPMAVAAAPASTATGNSTTNPDSHLMPAIQPTGSTTAAVHRPHIARPAARKRR